MNRLGIYSRTKILMKMRYMKDTDREELLQGLEYYHEQYKSFCPVRPSITSHTFKLYSNRIPNMCYSCMCHRELHIKPK